MYRAKLSARVVAPLLVAVLALIIGVSIAQGASFPADISGVGVSTTMTRGAPSATLTTDPGTASPPFTLQLDNSTTLAALTSGQLLVYNVDLKVGTKDNEELLTYDNATCVEGPNQLCITGRAKKGTTNQAHPAGSIVKLATQLITTPIGAADAAPFTIAVASTAGFPATLTTSANILIDNELFEVHNFGPNTFHVAKRGVETNPGNPTTQADHAVGAIITSPDTYIVTLSRQLHNTTDNTVSTQSKPYTFSQPLFPSIPQPFTPWDLGNAPIKLAFTVGTVSFPIVGFPSPTYNPSNGIFTIPFGACVWSGGGEDPPTTLLGSATLQTNKSYPSGNETGALGSIRDTTHSAYTKLLSTNITATTPALPFDMAVASVSAVTGPPAHGAFAASGQVLVYGELMTYDSVNTGANTLHITTRGDAGGSAAVAHAINEAVIQTPVCDEQAQGSRVDAHVLGTGTSPAFDSDGDNCSNWNELNVTAGSQGIGGLRDPWNPYDYMNPTKDGVNRVDDILAVVGQYHIDDMGSPDLKSQTDRTALTGGNAWSLGPPNGQQRVDDILAAVKQYHHDC